MEFRGSGSAFACPPPPPNWALVVCPLLDAIPKLQHAVWTAAAVILATTLGAAMCFWCCLF